MNTTVLGHPMTPQTSTNTASQAQAEPANTWMIGEQKLVAMLPTLMALSADEVGGNRMPIFELVTNMRLWLKNIERLRADFSTTFVEPPLAELDDLYSLLAVADHLAFVVKPSAPQTNLKKLTDEQLIPKRRMLKQVVELMGTFSGMSTAVLDQTLDGRTSKDVAHDLIQLTHALRASWGIIKGKAPFDLAFLDSIEHQAREAADLAAAVENLGEEQALDYDDLRNRVMVLILRKYAMVRSAVQYIRRAQGDADDFAPSAYVVRGGGPGRKGSPAKTPEPAPATPAPSGFTVSTSEASTATSDESDHVKPHAA
ncbi:MAG: hypothetical protein U0165_11415 [Polyangiaceae bacterium]